MYKLTIEFETMADLRDFLDLIGADDTTTAAPGAPAPKPRGRKPKAGAVDPANIANPPGAAPQGPVFTMAGTPANPIGSTPAQPSAGHVPHAPPMMPSPSIAGVPMAGPAGSAPAFTPPTFAPPTPPASMPAPNVAGYAGTPGAAPVAGAVGATNPASPAPSPFSMPQAGPPVQTQPQTGMTYDLSILPVLQRIGTEKGRDVVTALAQRYGVKTFPELPPALYGDFVWYTGLILNTGLDPRAGTQATPGAMY